MTLYGYSSLPYSLSTAISSLLTTTVQNMKLVMEFYRCQASDACTLVFTFSSNSDSLEIKSDRALETEMAVTIICAGTLLLFCGPKFCAS